MMNARLEGLFPRGRALRLAVALAPMAASGAFLAWYTSAVSVFIFFLWKTAAAGVVLAATASYSLWCRGRGWFEAEPTAVVPEESRLRARDLLRHAGKLVLAWTAALALNGGIAYWCMLPHPPGDAAMRRNFARHRTDLERLAAMAGEDRDMDRIAPEFKSPAKGGISTARWMEYRRLFRRAGTEDGLSRSSPEGDPLFIVWSWGLVIGGSSVGFVHCERPPDACFGGQESGRVDDQGDGYRFQRLAPDWYILEEWD